MDCQFGLKSFQDCWARALWVWLRLVYLLSSQAMAAVAMACHQCVVAATPSVMRVRTDTNRQVVPVMIMANPTPIAS